MTALYALLFSCSAIPQKDASGFYFLNDEPFTGKHIEYYGPKMPREELMIQNGVVLVRMSYDTNGHHRKTSIYNTSGLLQEMMELDAAGNLRVHKFFSSAGRLQEKKQFNTAGELLWREVYSYNSLGSVIETTIFNGKSEIISRTTLSPDSQSYHHINNMHNRESIYE